MYRLVVTTRPPTWGIASQLQVQIIVVACSRLTHQPVQFYVTHTLARLFITTYLTHTLCLFLSLSPLRAEPYPDSIQHPRKGLENAKLTSSIRTPLHRNNRIPLQPPRRRRPLRLPLQRLITRRRILNIQVQARLLRLDRGPDGELVGGGFWA